MTTMNSTAVPTNIITGFLGTGKTSSILHLLAAKPDDERWAILVNEFGEIGVDGSLFWGNHSQESGVFIREVPGGCMCCASGFPIQVALNQLLTRAKPDRLLIEPTGLGHPVEVLELLNADHYQGVLDIEKVITLVDARKLSDVRYTSHETFNQQIAIADVVVGNKQDLYGSEDKQALQAYVDRVAHHAPQLLFTEHGKLSVELLAGQTAAIKAENHDHDHDHDHNHDHADETLSLSEQPLPASGFIQALNEGEGFKSIGWRFSPETVFNRKQLCVLFSSLDVERMKAVFITDEGIFSYNLTPDALTEQALDEVLESRIEIIAAGIEPHWQRELFACQQ